MHLVKEWWSCISIRLWSCMYQYQGGDMVHRTRQHVFLWYTGGMHLVKELWSCMHQYNNKIITHKFSIALFPSVALWYTGGMHLVKELWLCMYQYNNKIITHKFSIALFPSVVLWYTGGMHLVKELWSCISIKVGTWLGARQDALAPRSVRGLGKLIMRGDRKVSANFTGLLCSRKSCWVPDFVTLVREIVILV